VSFYNDAAALRRSRRKPKGPKVPYQRIPEPLRKRRHQDPSSVFRIRNFVHFCSSEAEKRGLGTSSLPAAHETRRTAMMGEWCLCAYDRAPGRWYSATPRPGHRQNAAGRHDVCQSPRTRPVIFSRRQRRAAVNGSRVCAAGASIHFHRKRCSAFGEMSTAIEYAGSDHEIFRPGRFPYFSQTVPPPPRRAGLYRITVAHHPKKSWTLAGSVASYGLSSRLSRGRWRARSRRPPSYQSGEVADPASWVTARWHARAGGEKVKALQASMAPAR